MSAEAQVRDLLELWASRTRAGERDLILSHHAPDAAIYDVLPPLLYAGIAEYRAAWDDWQPHTEGESNFDLEDLTVRAGADCAFAFGLLRCGGTLVDGRGFSDLVRATFCLERGPDGWWITHQHISKPAGGGT